MSASTIHHSPSSLHDIMQTITTTVIPSGPPKDLPNTCKRQRAFTTTAHSKPARETAASTSTQKPPPDVRESPDYALFIAIDWADETHELCILDPRTGQRTHRVVKQSPNDLHAWIQDMQQRVPGQHIAIALEQTTGALIFFLMEWEWIDMYPINPMTLSRYRKALHVSGAKDDPTDAELLLDLLTLHRDKLRRLIPDTPLTRKLQHLTRDRRYAVNQRTRFTNELTALLKHYYPLFLEVCGEHLAAPLACELLLTYPCFEDLQEASPEALRQFYRSHGCWKAEVIEHRLALIRNAKALTTDHAIIQPAIMKAGMLAHLLLNIESSIKAYDNLIAELFSQHEDAFIFTSFPFAGAALAPRLMVAFGTNRERFKNATDVHNTTGISPVKRESGKAKSTAWRAVCPKFLRQTFHEYANMSIRKSIWARAYYQMQRDRGNDHHAAIRALAFKWIRIMFRCWQARQAYDELHYLSVLQHRHSPLLEYISKSDQMYGT
jgi:transposase